MSIRKDTRQIAGQLPDGKILIKSGEGGPRRITCPKHHLACTPHPDGKGGEFYICPSGCRLDSSRM